MKKLKYLQPNHENRFPNVKSGTMVLSSAVFQTVENEYHLVSAKSATANSIQSLWNCWLTWIVGQMMVAAQPQKDHY